MVQLAKDLPSELLQALYKIDTKRISKTQMENWFKVIESNYKSYFSERKISPVLVEHNLDIPIKIVVLLNKIDFNINILRKGIYLNIMKIWISQNLPLKG